MANSAANDYPGLGLPLHFWPQADKAYHGWNEYPPPTFPIGSHPNVVGSYSVLLPVREVAMMAVIDRLTDKPEWYHKVFDEAIVSDWKVEVMAVPDEEWMKIAAAPTSEWADARTRLCLVKGQRQSVRDVPQKVVGVMSDKAFDYCVHELRSKANYFNKTGLIPTLDASATVVKSDVLVKAELRDSLRQAFSQLQHDQADSPDCLPNSDGIVQILVHPSIFPLVYGRSKVLKDELVTVADAIEKWAGKGEVIPKSEEHVPDSPFSRLGKSDVLPSLRSSSHQWLPSNVSFQDDGSIKLTSYVNNLHPARYPKIYAALENLIETVLPAWDQSSLKSCPTRHSGHLIRHIRSSPEQKTNSRGLKCLQEYKYGSHYGPGRQGSRFFVPSGVDDSEPDNWNPPTAHAPELADVEIDFAKHARWSHVDDFADQKWMALRSPVLREPKPFAEAEYDPYKIMEDLGTPPSKYSPKAEPPSRALMGGLRRKFEASGLQVIVKMISIELTPEQPERSAGGWHIKGLLNERICATALYYLDSENITDSNLSFRMQTASEQDRPQTVDFIVDSYHWMECNYGTTFSASGSCVQNYGSVNTREGRLLAFPNVFQHRVSSIQLADPTKPGHQHVIALCLVDPHQRIISTANVPPQQQTWWLESVFGSSPDSQAQAADKLPADIVRLLREKGVVLPRAAKERDAKLPSELRDMVREDWSLGTLSPQEAKEEQLKLMTERLVQQDTMEREWSRAKYSFRESDLDFPFSF